MKFARYKIIGVFLPLFVVLVIGLIAQQVSTNQLRRGALQMLSVNGILTADMFPGSDIHDQVATAFAQQGGTSSSPASSVVVYLSPKSYSFSKPIEIPNQTAAPYITTPILDCNGSTLTYTGNNASPAILVHGENVGDSILGGMMRNCTISRSDANGPVVTNNDRMGWHMSNVALYGGQDSYYVNLNSAEGPTYLEQSYLDNVSFMNPSRDGIHVHNGAGGNGGYQYNGCHKCRFQFNGDGHAEIHFETGINAFNGAYQTQVNTGGTGKTYIIEADTGAVVLSTTIEFNGEGSTGLGIGGGGAIDLSCNNIARMNMQMDGNAVCHGPDTQMGTGTGLYGYLNGFFSPTRENSNGFTTRNSATYDNGTHWVRFDPIAGGTEMVDGSEQFVACVTGTPYSNNAWDSTKCTNQLFHQGTSGWGFGPGYGPDTSGATARTIYSTVDVSGTGVNSVAYKTNNIAGVTCAGVPTSSYAVTNGIVTHC